MKTTRYLFGLIVLFWLVFTGTVQASMVNINDFFSDPSVTISPDGFSALIKEDQNLSLILLANDPGLGDSNVIIPGPGISLLFDYDFTEKPGENNEFGAFVIDSVTGLSIGSTFEFFTQDSSTGSLSFDLSSLSGQTLGLQFQLSSLFGDTGFDSTVTVSNVRLETSAVPIPATLLLFSSGLIGMFGISFKRKTS